MKGFVYSLCRPGTNDIFYVGCTEKSLEQRLAGHISCIRDGKSDIHRYMRENNIVPEIEIVESIVYRNKNNLFKTEEFWIEQFRQWGFILINSINRKPGKMRVRHPKGSGSVKIEPDVLEKAVKHCQDNGIKISFFATEAVKEKLLTLLIK